MKALHRPKIIEPAVEKPKKPTLLMNIGVGWAATTPMCYTLSINQRYCHPGHIKENHYLRALCEEKGNVYTAWNWMSQTVKDEMMWTYCGWKPVEHAYCAHFHENDYIHKWWEKPLRVEKYIDYYLRHWEHIKGDYVAVADFCNNNWNLPLVNYGNAYWGKYFIEEIQKHFDIKVLVEFRDPIRRLYSELGALFGDIAGLIAEHEEGEDAPANKLRRMGIKLIKQNRHNDFFQMALKFHIDGGGNCEYIKCYNAWEEIVGKDNILGVVMEEFWNPQYKREQCERLSNFLDYPIKSIYPNAYFPDLGSDAPKLTGLIDQKSDRETISEESIQKAIPYMRRHYKDWKGKFGSIPESWHYEDMIYQPSDKLATIMKKYTT